MRVEWPILWTRRPDNPLLRLEGYNRLNLACPEPNSLRDLFWTIYPSASKMPVAEDCWRDSYLPLNKDDEVFWREQTGINDPKKLDRHFHNIRMEAWQVVQEFSLARWWFLRDIMARNPYYAEVKQLAKTGATIVDLGCGLGQDLRRLRSDGATGELIGVDERPALWELGRKLFRDKEGEKTYSFRGLNIIEIEMTDHRNPLTNCNPLAQFADKADVYLLNDVISCWGGKYSQGCFNSIHRASRIGTKVFGWMIGQEGPSTGGGKELGDGRSFRGDILTLQSFLNGHIKHAEAVDAKIRWDIEAQLVGFDRLGLDEDDQIWFQSDFWAQPIPENRPNELKAICFLATRVV